MSNPIAEVVNFLGTPTLDIPEHRRTEIQSIVNHLLEADLSPENITVVENTLKSGLSTKDPYKAILVASLLFTITGKQKYANLLPQRIRAFKPNLQTANTMFTTAAKVAFMNPDEAAKPGSFCGRAIRRHLFLTQLKYLQTIYKHTIPGQSRPFSRTNKVIVATKQMLFPPHAPSVRTLEFSYDLITKHGKEVLIVCTGEASNSAANSPLLPVTVGYSDERFFTVDNITYEGLKIPFYVADKGTFSTEGLQKTIQTIHDFEPEMILSIGAPNLIPELFHESSFCFFYMSGRGLPLSVNHHYHTWDEPTVSEQKTMKQEGIQDKHLFVSTPGYHVRQQFVMHKRADVNIPEDAFVFAIIGLRLDKEITPEFMTVMEKVQAATNCYFLFAGIFETYQETIEGFSQKLFKYCHFMGMQQDIMAVYELTNAFLNPERAGGGSSAAQALQANIPVLTTTVGDVGFMAKNFPKLETYDELTETAIKLVTDEETQAAYKEYTNAERKRVSVRDQYLDRIIEEFEKYAAKELNQAAE